MSALPPLNLLPYPYTAIEDVADKPDRLREAGKEPGTALVWCMEHGSSASRRRQLCERPGGLSLIALLPPARNITREPDLIHVLQQVRPHAILPHHPDPDPRELAQVLRRPPTDLAAEMTDYLRWRGLGIDRDTAHLIRRILDLSVELRSVSAVSRSMYLSRRALGRRLMSKGLPVPSHWLQVGRVLRVAVRLQNSDATVASIGFDLGYPDGFSVSNQMERLVGHRPSEIRKRLGWEWVVEAWLRREAENGGLSTTVMGTGSRETAPARRDDASFRSRRRSRSSETRSESTL